MAVWRQEPGYGCVETGTRLWLCGDRNRAVAVSRLAAGVATLSLFGDYATQQDNQQSGHNLVGRGGSFTTLVQPSARLWPSTLYYGNFSMQENKDVRFGNFDSVPFDSTKIITKCMPNQPEIVNRTCLHEIIVNVQGVQYTDIYGVLNDVLDCRFMGRGDAHTLHGCVRWNPV